MKKLSYFFIALIFILIILLLLPLFVNIRQYKPALEEKINQATGKQIEFGENIRFQIIPNIQVIIPDIKFKDQNMDASISRLDLSLGFFDLIQGKINIKSIEIERPKISYKSTKSAKAISEEKEEKKKLVFNRVIINDGYLNYLDEGFIVEKVNLDINVKNKSFELSAFVPKAKSTISLKSVLKIEENRYKAENLELKIDDNIELYSQIDIDNRTTIPKFKIFLDITKADFRSYQDLFASNVNEEKKASSKKDIDLKILQQFNGQLAIRAKEIKTNKFEIDGLKLHNILRHGELNSKIDELSLYDGMVEGEIIFSSVKDTASVNLEINKVDITKMFKSVKTKLPLNGITSAKIDLKSQGKSQKKLIDNLEGNLNISIESANILAKKFPILNLLGLNIDKDNLADVMGSFSINNGIATNNDLTLISPTIDIEGQGFIDIRNEIIDFKLMPKGKSQKRVIPVFIRGKFDDLAVVPDIAAPINNEIEKSLDKLIDKGLNKILGF